LITDLAKNDGRAAGNRWQHVDTISVVKRLRCVDEVTIDSQAHAFEKSRQRRKSIDDGHPELGLGRAFRRELEHRALAPCELPGGSIVVNADLHDGREA